MRSLFFILLVTVPATALSEARQEEILQRKAVLMAKKVHLRNLNLIGIDPQTCKPVEDSKVFLNQMAQIKKGSLKHCPEYAQEKLRWVDEEIRQVEAGVLIYPKRASAPVIPSLSPNPEEAFRVEENPPLTVEALDQSSSSADLPETASIDHTGLSEEQKLRIFEFYNQNKERYETDDLDNLFQIVSKAYVRNLRKIIPEN